MYLKLFILLYFLFYINCSQINCPEICVCNMQVNLRAVFCNNEKITTIDNDIPSEVQYLDYSFNIISQINDFSFTDLKNIVILNISSNSLSQVSLRAFEGLDKLQILDLSHNILGNIPQDVFETNKMLLKVYLGENKFGFLNSEPLLSSGTIQVLDVNNCGITHLYDTTFSMLLNLTSVDISNNYIIQLNINVFANLKNLKSLEIAGNKLNCNTEMSLLTNYLTKQQINFNNICQIKKFEKIIMQETTTEKNHLINWNFDNCDIEMTAQMSNHTCQIVYDSNMSKYIIIFSFLLGLIIGICCTCCYVNILIFCKQKRKTIRKKIIPTYNTKNEQLLLNETCYNLGLSTPILSRNRLTTPIK